jgi:hypothetical protein
MRESIESYISRGGQITLCPVAYAVPSRQYGWVARDAAILAAREIVVQKPLRPWHNIPGAAVIEILVPGNPYKNKSSAAHLQFERYEHGKTIEYHRRLIGGMNRTSVISAVRRGYIRLSGVAIEPKPPRPPRPTANAADAPDSAVITVLALTWRKRENTVAHQRYLSYRTGITVGEWRSATGIKRRPLLRDVRSGLISLRTPIDHVVQGS